MKTTQPLVSVVMIFLNTGKFIREAIESVRAQTYDHWELLLVDDGSTDDGTAIAREYAARFPDQVRYIEHPGHANLGTGASRNVGIKNGRGELVTFLDADDIWLPRKLEIQVALLQSHPEVPMMYGRTLYWYSWTGKPEDAGRDFVTNHPVVYDSVIPPPRLVVNSIGPADASPCVCSILARRELFDRVGYFEEKFRGLFEDRSFCTKVFLQWPVFVSNECLEWYRQHPDSTCARAVRNGEWVHGKLGPHRKRLLRWVRDQARLHNCTDPELWSVLNYAIWPYDHPIRYRVRPHLRRIRVATDQFVRWVARHTLNEPVRRALWKVRMRFDRD